MCDEGPHQYVISYNTCNKSKGTQTARLGVEPFAPRDVTVLQKRLALGKQIPASGAKHPSGLIMLRWGVWLNVKDTLGVTGQRAAPMIRFDLFCLMRPINNTLAF